MFPIYLFFLIPLFALIDRMVGSGEFGRTKPLAVAALFGGGLAFFALGAPFALVGLAWAVWRSIPFFNGAGAPENGEERLAALCRQLLLVPIAVVACRPGDDCKLLAVLLLGAALVNTGMRVAYGDKVLRAKRDMQELPSDFSIPCELVSGATFGLSLVIYAALHLS